QARDIAISIEMHGASRRGLYPVAGLPALADRAAHRAIDSEAALFLADPDQARWETRSYWWTAMTDVAPIEDHWPAWVSPGAETHAAWLNGPDYRFSNSFVAAAALWRSQ